MDDEWRVYLVFIISLNRTDAYCALCECMAAKFKIS